MYLAFKHIHLTAIVLSLTLFFIRAFIVLILNAPIKPKWLRIMPHMIDTLLLASAIGLCLVSSQYPIADNWLTAKVLALFVYIGAGVFALKVEKPRPVRFAAFGAALLAVIYIVSVAFSRNPMPWG